MTDVYYYEHAGHAFCDYMHRDYYKEGATRLACERIEAFLARHYPAQPDGASVAAQRFHRLHRQPASRRAECGE